MPRLRILASASCLLALLVAGEVRAESHQESGASAVAVEGSGEETSRITLPSGTLLAFVPVAVNLSKGAVAKPVAVAPDIWYGVADSLSIGLVHSAQGRTGFVAGSAEGVCVTGEASCGELYDNVGLDIRLGLLSGSFMLALDAGAFVEPFDPLTVSAKGGLLGMLRAGPLSIVFNPTYAIGVTERAAGDRGQIGVPVTLAVGIGSLLGVGVQSGVVGSVKGFADSIVVPLAAGVRVSPTAKLSFDVAVSLPTFYTRAAKSTDFDSRTLVFSTSLAL